MRPAFARPLPLLIALLGSPMARAADLKPIPERQSVDENAWTRLPAGLRAAQPADRLHALESLSGTPAEQAAWLEIVVRTDPSTTVRRAAARLVAANGKRGQEVAWNTDILRRSTREAPTVAERLEAAELLASFAGQPVLAELLSSPNVGVRQGAAEALSLRASEPWIADLATQQLAVESDPVTAGLLRTTLEAFRGSRIASAPTTSAPSEPVAQATPPAGEPAPALTSPVEAPAPEATPAVSSPTAAAPTVAAPTAAAAPVASRAPSSTRSTTEARAPSRSPTVRAASAAEPAMEPTQKEIGTPPSEREDLFVAAMMGYGGYLGGMGAWLFGEALETEDSQHTWGGVAPGAVLGAGVGLGTAMLLRPRIDVPRQDAVVYSSTTVLGGIGGYELGRLFIADDEPAARERKRAASLAGTMAGAGSAILITDRDIPTGATLRVDYTAGLGLLAGASLPEVLGQEWPNAAEAGAELGLMLAGGGAGMLMNRADLGPPGPGAVLVGYGQGVWVGSTMPQLFNEELDDQKVWAGARVGLALGLADTTIMRLGGEPDSRSIALQSVGILAGNTLGAGAALMATSEDRSPPTLAIASLSGVAGQALGAVVAPHYTISENDAYLMATLGTWTAFQSAGWGVYTREVTSGGPQSLGVALTTGGAGVLGTVGLAPLIDATPSESMQLLATAGWGTWTGAWIGKMADLDAGPGWLVMLSSGDAALIGAGVAEGLGWSPDWGDVAAINGLGLLGAAAGGLVGVLFLYQDGNWDPLIASTLVGSGLGLAGGGVLAARSNQRDEQTTLHLPDLPGLPGAPSLTFSPWMDEAGGEGLYVRASLDGW